MRTGTTRPGIGVSACLLGERVRYDGEHKLHAVIEAQLAPLFEIIAICPEVEAGLGVPRPPVQLVSVDSEIRVQGRDDSELDVTDVLQGYCQQRISELSTLNGFVLQSRSPSCGYNTTPVYKGGETVTTTASGIFAQAVLRAYPGIAIIDDEDLSKPLIIKDFIENVRANHNRV